MIDLSLLKEQAACFGFELSPRQLEQFDCYAQLLVEWNQRMNLTAITRPEEIVEKHFVDSLLALAAADIPENGRLIDVGTGAGFPGLPLKIFRPDLELTLLDSLNKRVTFLQAVCGALGCEAQAIHARAEEAGRGKLREDFHWATARAVAHLRELGEYCLPFVKVGGAFLALKGLEVEQELEEGSRAISLLGGKIEEVRRFRLPGGGGRSIVVIRKISQSPPKYPRPAAKIAKSPLG